MCHIIVKYYTHPCTDCISVDDVVNEVVVNDFTELKFKGFDIKQIDKIMEKL